MLMNLFMLLQVSPLHFNCHSFHLYCMIYHRISVSLCLLPQIIKFASMNILTSDLMCVLLCLCVLKGTNLWEKSWDRSTHFCKFIRWTELILSMAIPVFSLICCKCDFWTREMVGSWRACRSHTGPWIWSWQGRSWPPKLHWSCPKRKKMSSICKFPY